MGEAELTKNEYCKFNRGDTIWGSNSEVKEIKRWNFEQESEAREELSKCKCVYHSNIDSWSIEEYALEYCECDKNGEFVEGSDYDLAELG